MPAERTALFCGMGPVRPLRELLHQLPLLAAMQPARPGAAGGSPAFLASVAGNADATMRIVQLGLAAMGNLVARCSLDLQDGTVSAECIENLGFLMAELGDLAAECLRITSACRSEAPAPKEGAADA
jgi:hypothetical protein